MLNEWGGGLTGLDAQFGLCVVQLLALVALAFVIIVENFSLKEQVEALLEAEGFGLLFGLERAARLWEVLSRANTVRSKQHLPDLDLRSRPL